MSSFISFVTMLIFLAGLTYSNIKNMYLFRILFKTLTSVSFLLIAFVTKRNYAKTKTTRYFKLMSLGLVCSFFGDVLLAIADTSKGICFVLGVISFALAHVAYTIAFFQYGKFCKTNALWFAILLFFVFALISIPNLFDFAGLKPLIIGYGVLISFMVSKSFSLWKYKKQNPYFVSITIAGAVLFLISDSLLLFSLFGDASLSYFLTINNVIYYIGQALFGLSFKKELLLADDCKKAV